MALFSEMMEDIDKLNDGIRDLMAENERLRDALEVFANRASVFIAPEETVTFFMKDCVNARKALTPEQRETP